MFLQALATLIAERLTSPPFPDHIVVALFCTAGVHRAPTDGLATAMEFDKANKIQTKLYMPSYCGVHNWLKEVNAALAFTVDDRYIINGPGHAIHRAQSKRIGLFLLYFVCFSLPARVLSQI
jgi:hypothetical protein